MVFDRWGGGGVRVGGYLSAALRVCRMRFPSL